VGCRESYELADVARNFVVYIAYLIFVNLLKCMILRWSRSYSVETEFFILKYSNSIYWNKTMKKIMNREIFKKFLQNCGRIRLEMHLLRLL